MRPDVWLVGLYALAASVALIVLAFRARELRRHEGGLNLKGGSWRLRHERILTLPKEPPVFR